MDVMKQMVLTRIEIVYMEVFCGENVIAGLVVCTSGLRIQLWPHVL